MTATPACDHLRVDHRELEAYLDHLLATLQRLSPDLVPQVEAVVCRVQRLAAIHFEKEESIFYPSLRLALPELLAQMDQRHEQIRESEKHVAEMLSDPPQPPESRWLNDLRMSGTNSTTLFSTTTLKRKTICSGWPGAAFQGRPRAASHRDD